MKTKYLFLLLILIVATGTFAQNTDIIDDVYFKPSNKTITPKANTSEKARYKNGAKEIIFIDRDSVDVAVSDSAYLLAQANDSTEYADYDEDGYYLHGFNGSASDLEYAERIRRFHNPKYRIFIGNSNYSDIYFLNNSDWNVYVDDFYAYVTPTWTNPYWFDYMYRPFSYNSWHWGSSWNSPYSFYGGWGYNSWGYNPWGYNSWYSPFYSSWGYPYYGYYGYYDYGWGYPYYGYGNYWGGGYNGSVYKDRNYPMSNTANRRVAGNSRTNANSSRRMEAVTIGGRRNVTTNRNTYTALSSGSSRNGASINSSRSVASTSSSFRNSGSAINSGNQTNRNSNRGEEMTTNRNSRYSTGSSTGNITNRTPNSNPTTERGTYNQNSRSAYNSGNVSSPRTSSGAGSSVTNRPTNSSGRSGSYSTGRPTSPRSNYSTGTPTRSSSQPSSSYSNSSNSRYSGSSNSSSSSSSYSNSSSSSSSYSGGSSSSSGSSSSRSSGGSSGGGGGRR